MKRIFFCLFAVLAIGGCKEKKEENPADVQAAFHQQFRKMYADSLNAYSGWGILVFFVDVDGDGVDEAFASLPENTHQDGNYWHLFSYRKGVWIETNDNPDPFNYLHGFTKDIYYRDDVKRQPRLFIKKCFISSPASVTLKRNRKGKYLLVAPFDKDEARRLWAEGILKPVEAHWYDENNQIVCTEEESVVAEDWDEEEEGQWICVEPPPDFDDPIDSVPPQTLVLTVNPNKSRDGSPVLSGTMQAVAGQPYLQNFSWKARNVPTPFNARLKWEVTAPDGQTCSGETAISKRDIESAEGEDDVALLDALCFITVPDNVQGVSNKKIMEVQLEIWIAVDDEEAQIIYKGATK